MSVLHLATGATFADLKSSTVLDQFARQNLAEIDEIPYEEEIVKVKLPAAEMAYVLSTAAL